MAVADEHAGPADHDHDPRRRLTFTPVAGVYAVCRLAADAPWPAWAAGGPFVPVTRTADETSAVCPAAAVPAGVGCEGGWRCLRVAGPLDFGMVGVLAGFVGPLAGVGVSVFVLSTFDSDYLFVKSIVLSQVIDVLRQAGHEVAR
jgi:hypothetical protein